MSRNGDRINTPDPVNTWLKSRHRFKLQDFSRHAEKGTGFASFLGLSFQDDAEQCMQVFFQG